MQYNNYTAILLMENSLPLKCLHGCEAVNTQHCAKLAGLLITLIILLHSPNLFAIYI